MRLLLNYKFVLYNIIFIVGLKGVLTFVLILLAIFLDLFIYLYLNQNKKYANVFASLILLISLSPIAFLIKSGPPYVFEVNLGDMIKSFVMETVKPVSEDFIKKNPKKSFSIVAMATIGSGVYGATLFNDYYCKSQIAHFEYLESEADSIIERQSQYKKEDSERFQDELRESAYEEKANLRSNISKYSNKKWWA